MRSSVLLHLAAAALAAAKTPVFETSDASAAGSVTGFEFKKRVVVPYGVGDACVGGTDCKAFGFGGAEQSAYDAAEKLVYAVSEQNSIAVVDATTMEWKVSWSAGAVGALTSAKVCGGKLYVAAAADVKTDDGSVLVYDTVKRSDMTTAPALLQTVTVGPLPDMILPNGACTILAVANEGEGKQDDAGVLVDPVGSVDLVDLATYAVSRVDFAGLAATDADLEAKGVDQLLSLASMTYFNDHSYLKDGLDWDSAIAAYSPATQLEPEYLAWSGDDATVYVNLQENSAVVAVDAATATAADVFGLGLKSWAATKIDTVKDGECILATKPGFATMRIRIYVAKFAAREACHTSLLGSLSWIYGTKVTKTPPPLRRSVLVLEPLLPLLEDRELDALALRQRHLEVVILADDEDVREPRRELVVRRVADRDDVEGPGVLLDVHDRAHPTGIAALRDHARHAHIKFNGVDDLARLQVDLDDVVDLDRRRRVADGAAVVRREDGDLLRRDVHGLHATQLVRLLRVRDPM